MKKKNKKKNTQGKDQVTIIAELPPVNARHLSDLPPWLFWGLFFLFSGYFLLVKISSVDLWWHMACGRYLVENGVYPPTGTFTFSPVNPTTSNASTWLGDIVLYVIYAFLGNEIGLQIFRIIAITIPVIVFVKLSGKRYNTWTLLGSQVLVWGTMQQHLLRNSIFAMIFLPLMVLIWHSANSNRSFKPLFLFPALLLFWTHMHGYALVGLGILMFFFIGDIVDQAIGNTERNKKFTLVFLIVLTGSWAIVSVNWALNPVAILRNVFNPLNSYLSVVDDRRLPDLKMVDMGDNHRFSSVDGDQSPADMPMNDSDISSTRNIQSLSGVGHAINFLCSIFSPENVFASVETGPSELDQPSFRRIFIQIKDRIKWLFRPFLRGGDAEYIEEYRSPFDAWGTLPAKVLFAFSFSYLIYLAVALKFDRSGIKISYLLPSMACIFLGLGHLRTMAFPFLVALPLMTAHLPSLSLRLKENQGETFRFIWHFLPWAGIMSYVITVGYYYPESLFFPIYFTGMESIGDAACNFLSDHHMLVFTLAYVLMVVHLGMAFRSMKEKNGSFYRILISACFSFSAVALTAMIQPAHFLDQPVGFLLLFPIIPVIAVDVRKMTPICRNQWYFRFSPLIFWLLPLLFSAQFAMASHYSYIKIGFIEISGMSGWTPGIGKNILFRDLLPDYILDHYSGENIFNSYNIGGYLIWKWYADKKVFIDSRSANYKNDFYEDYRRNYAYTYFEQMNLEKALLSIAVDKAWYDEYLNRNWTPIALDTSMVLLKRTMGDGYALSYCIIPKFFGKAEDIKRLSSPERKTLGLFISNILRYMLLYGRVADADRWIQELEPVIETLDVEEQSYIQETTQFIKLMVKHFGQVNDPVLADACRKLEDAYSPINLNIVIGDVHKNKNQRKEAAMAYLAAAQLGQENIALQRKVADRMFEMKLVNQAISQYEVVIRLQPGIVDAYFKLGYLYSLKKDYDAAEVFLRQLLVYAPDIQETYSNLAAVLVANGKSEEAIKVYETGLDRLPGNNELQKRLDLLKGEG